jgi:tRNA G18 (ribose-2'-O)-methylase SpoU
VTRRQLLGPDDLAAALSTHAPLQLVLLRREAPAAVRALAEDARRAGIRVAEISDNDMRRMRSGVEPCDVLALVGSDPAASPSAVQAAGGAIWLLAGVGYAGNAGFAIRTAEVSGAAGIFLDSTLDAAGRKRALRMSMHADRFFPVHWIPAEVVIDAARAAGRRIVAIEDHGAHAPWATDLRGPILLAIGGERDGLAPTILTRCVEVVRIPMAGFVPSYNLQAAMAAVAVERLRQDRGSAGAGS